MSMMNGIPDRCPRCDAWGFEYAGYRSWRPSEPARPARLWGLIPARPAKPAKWLYRCPFCEYEDTYQAKDRTAYIAGIAVTSSQPEEDADGNV